QIPELFVIDSGGQLRRNATVCERGLRDILHGRLRGRQVRFGERARRETNPRRSELAEAPADVRGDLLELESPGRGARVHMQRPVARDPGGPRIAGDLFADGGWPCLGDPADRRLRTEARKLGAYVVSERIQAPPPRSAPVRPGAR